MGEVKRIFNKKMWLLIIVAVIVNLILFMYSEMAGKSLSDTFSASRQYRQLIERYRGMESSVAEERVGTELTAISRYVRSLTADTNTADALPASDGEEVKEPTTEEILSQADDACREMIEYYQTLDDAQQTQLKKQMKQLRTKLNYLSGYRESVNAVFTNAENMKRFSIFSKQDSFSYSNILRTAEDFKRVENVSLTLDNDKGADEFVHYNIMYYIAAALMLVVIYGLFDERENGMWQLVHNTPNGRTVLAVKRLVLLLGGSFVILSVLYWSTFAVSMLLYGGFSDLANPVQTLEDYGKFTFAISKGGYIVRLFFLSWFILCGICVILWSLFIVFRNRNHTLICTAAFVGIEILIYQKIEIQSVYNAFHYINVISLLRISELYSTYINWGFGTYVFSVLSVVIFAMAVLLVVMSAAAIWRYTDMRPETKVSWLGKVFNAVHRQYQKIFVKYPVVLKEIHKLIITGKGMWALVSVIIIAVYFSVSGQMTFTDAQKERDKMYIEHGGSDYTYISDYVEEKQADYRNALEKMTEAAQQYENGEIDINAYSEAVNAVTYQSAALATISEYVEKLNYAERMSEEKNIDVWLVSDRGYEEIFGKYGQVRELILLIALVVAVMLIVSESISMEYRTGMRMIIHSADRGRGWILRRKITACIIFTTVLTFIVYGIDYWNMYRIYGMPYLSAPAVSLTFLEDTFANLALHVNIGGWILILLFARWITALATMTAALLVSKAIGKKGSRSIMPVVLAGLIAVIYVVHVGVGFW
jgi:hypothetical protein